MKFPSFRWNEASYNYITHLSVLWRTMLVCIKLARKYWKFTGLLLVFLLSSGFLLRSYGPPTSVRKLGSSVKQAWTDTKTSDDFTQTFFDHSSRTSNRVQTDNLALRDVVEVSAIRSMANSEVQHIGFLKVHKAASSTMQNMFFRFGLKRNLTFVFTEHPNYFSRVYNKHIPLVKPTRRSGYDILCNHGVFNYNIYSSLLPNDTVYVGIVRDPLAVFISAVNYYTQKSQLIQYLGKIPGNKLQNLIRKPEIYDKGAFSYTKNVMARDFGFTPRLRSVSDKLQELDSHFKLVLLVEYFDESLILMRRYFNWKLKDILYISNNVYGKGLGVKDMTPSDIVLFRKRNALDYSLYEHYYRRFWIQFDKESEDIHSEVVHFKSVLRLVFTYCNNPNITDNYVIPESTWGKEIIVSKLDCKYMKMDELEFIKHLRTLQGSELGRKKPLVRVIKKGK